MSMSIYVVTFFQSSRINCQYGLETFLDAAVNYNVL